MKKSTHRPAIALALAASLALAGCAGETEATFEPDSAASSEQAPAADPADGSTQTSPAEDEEAAEDAPLEPAAPRTIEVDETESFGDGDTAFTLTVHRVVVNDYYVEAEVTLVNDSDETLRTWRGGGSRSAPRVYDDRGRDYPFQAQPGSDGSQLTLQGSEGLDAVLVFAGRLDPDSRQLTLDLSEIGSDWSQMTFEVPIEDAR